MLPLSIYQLFENKFKYFDQLFELLIDHLKMNIFHEDGRGNITDESGKEAPAFLVDPSFRLANLTNLPKYIKNANVVAEIEPPIDTVMSDAPAEKERTTVYNTYSFSYCKS